MDYKKINFMDLLFELVRNRRPAETKAVTRRDSPKIDRSEVLFALPGIQALRPIMSRSRNSACTSAFSAFRKFGSDTVLKVKRWHPIVSIERLARLDDTVDKAKFRKFRKFRVRKFSRNLGSGLYLIPKKTTLVRSACQRSSRLFYAGKCPVAR